MRKKVGRVCDPARRTLRVKIRSHRNSRGGRFHQVTKLAAADLASLGGPEQKSFSLHGAPLAFPMATAFYGAPVEVFVLLVELVDCSCGDQLLIRCWPCFFVESGKDQVRPRLPLGFRVGEQMNATVRVCTAVIAA